MEWLVEDVMMHSSAHGMEQWEPLVMHLSSRGSSTDQGLPTEEDLLLLVINCASGNLSRASLLLSEGVYPALQTRGLNATALILTPAETFARLDIQQGVRWNVILHDAHSNFTVLRTLLKIVTHLRWGVMFIDCDRIQASHHTSVWVSDTHDSDSFAFQAMEALDSFLGTRPPEVDAVFLAPAGNASTVWVAGHDSGNLMQGHSIPMLPPFYPLIDPAVFLVWPSQGTAALLSRAAVYEKHAIAGSEAASEAFIWNTALNDPDVVEELRGGKTGSYLEEGKPEPDPVLLLSALPHAWKYITAE
jgi:hypothetical protein